MKFERLRSKKKITLFIIIILLILIAIVLGISFASYKKAQEIIIYENNNIYYPVPDLTIDKVYVSEDGKNYNKTNKSIPSEGYLLKNKPNNNDDMNYSHCELNGEKQENVVIEYNEITKKLNISNIDNDKIKCSLYFYKNPNYLNLTEKGEKHNEIINNSKKGPNNPNFQKTSCTNGTNNGGNCEEETVGLYKHTETTADGTTIENWYFRGDVQDNWVKFAGFYWQIVRINETGSLRLIHNRAIYDDKNNVYTSPFQDGYRTSVGGDVYSSGYNDNMYVGFMYTEGEIHGNKNKSKVLAMLEKWYSKNLKEYDNYMDKNVGFCGDRTTYKATARNSNGEPTEFAKTNENEEYGKGQVETYYGPYVRNKGKYYVGEKYFANGNPSFLCENSNDLYTVKCAENEEDCNNRKGNKSLDYPIGLITMDEAIFAGATYQSKTNYSFYLNSKIWQNTMSPRYFRPNMYITEIAAYTTQLNSSGQLTYCMTDGARENRAVINVSLKDLSIKGKGTKQFPYELEIIPE